MPQKSGKSTAKATSGPKKTTGTKAQKPRHAKLPSANVITRRAASLLWQHWRLFAGITLIYGLVNFMFVQGFSGASDVPALKETFNQIFTGNFGFLASGLSTFAVMLGSAGNTTSQTAGAYQAILAIIASLAVIWTLRTVASGDRPRVRDAYYRGMTPFVPFVLVLLVVALQLLPLIIGSGLYSLVITNGIAIYAMEKLFWGSLFGVFGLLSFYMLSSSLFALYIVTLPDMTPMKALRSARELVRHRRWTVLRKLLCLPLILLVVAAAIMVPIIILLTPLAPWIFFLLTMSALTVGHTYIYTLYRELLNE